MTKSRTIAELRYDGPMPPEVIDRLRYGSATNAEIARTEDSIAFHEEHMRRMEKSALKWRDRGNLKMMDLNIETAEFHARKIGELRERLFHLKDQRATGAALKGAKQFFDILSPKEPDDA